MNVRPHWLEVSSQNLHSRVRWPPVHKGRLHSNQEPGSCGFSPGMPARRGGCVQSVSRSQVDLGLLGCLMIGQCYILFFRELSGWPSGASVTLGATGR